MTRSKTRRGFTLIEMLVVMALIATLAAIAMVVVPSVMDRDRSVDAVSNVQGWLQIAQARAARDRQPRGVRFIIDPAKPAGEQLFATEAQYIESPPVLVFNQNPPYPNGFLASFQPHPWTPRVEFSYLTSLGGPGNPPAGTISSTPPGNAARFCHIRGLTIDQANLLISYAANNNQPVLWMPVLGTWHRILTTNPAFPSLPVAVTPATTPASYDVALTLDRYPDTQFGASTSYVTHYFGIYGPPRPLLGEPTMQLPTNTCVDLSANVSLPDGTQDLGFNRDYDILFAPSGQVAFTPTIQGASHVFLWIRDPRKVASLVPAPGPPLTYSLASIQQGGEMMIIAIKAKSGAIGVAPVDHNAADPYSLARQAVVGQ